MIHVPDIRYGMAYLTHKPSRKRHTPKTPNNSICETPIFIFSKAHHLQGVVFVQTLRVPNGVYQEGGTPTSLSKETFGQLLFSLAEALHSSPTTPTKMFLGFWSFRLLLWMLYMYISAYIQVIALWELHITRPQILWSEKTKATGYKYMAMGQKLMHLFWYDYHLTVLFQKLFGCASGYRGFEPQPLTLKWQGHGYRGFHHHI